MKERLASAGEIFSELKKSKQEMLSVLTKGSQADVSQIRGILDSIQAQDAKLLNARGALITSKEIKSHLIKEAKFENDRVQLGAQEQLSEKIKPESEIRQTIIDIENHLKESKELVKFLQTINSNPEILQIRQEGDFNKYGISALSSVISTLQDAKKSAENIGVGSELTDILGKNIVTMQIALTNKVKDQINVADNFDKLIAVSSGVKLMTDPNLLNDYAKKLNESFGDLLKTSDGTVFEQLEKIQNANTQLASVTPKNMTIPAETAANYQNKRNQLMESLIDDLSKNAEKESPKSFQEKVADFSKFQQNLSKISLSLNPDEQARIENIKQALTQSIEEKIDKLSSTELLNSNIRGDLETAAKQLKNEAIVDKLNEKIEGIKSVEFEDFTKACDDVLTSDKTSIEQLTQMTQLLSNYNTLVGHESKKAMKLYGEKSQVLVESVTQDLYKNAKGLFQNLNTRELVQDKAEKVFSGQKTGNLPEMPTWNALSDNFNLLSEKVVVESVKNIKDLSGARLMVLQWIEVAGKALEQGDFYTSLAIYTRLISSDLYYIFKEDGVHGKFNLPKKQAQHYENMKTVFSEDKGFMALRNAVDAKSKGEGPCIPAYVMYVKDLDTELQYANGDVKKENQAKMKLKQVFDDVISNPRNQFKQPKGILGLSQNDWKNYWTKFEEIKSNPASGSLDNIGIHLKVCGELQIRIISNPDFTKNYFEQERAFLSNWEKTAQLLGEDKYQEVFQAAATRTLRPDVLGEVWKKIGDKTAHEILEGKKTVPEIETLIKEALIREGLKTTEIDGYVKHVKAAYEAVQKIHQTTPLSLADYQAAFSKQVRARSKQEDSLIELDKNMNHGYIERQFGNPKLIAAMDEFFKQKPHITDPDILKIFNHFEKIYREISDLSSQLKQFNSGDPLKDAEDILKFLEKDDNYKVIVNFSNAYNQLRYLSLGHDKAGVAIPCLREFLLQKEVINENDDIGITGIQFITKYDAHLKADGDFAKSLEVLKNEGEVNGATKLWAGFNKLGMAANAAKVNQFKFEKFEELKGGHGLQTSKLPTGVINAKMNKLFEIIKQYDEKIATKQEISLEERNALKNEMGELKEMLETKLAGKVGSSSMTKEEKEDAARMTKNLSMLEEFASQNVMSIPIKHEQKEEAAKKRSMSDASIQTESESERKEDKGRERLFSASAVEKVKKVKEKVGHFRERVLSVGKPSKKAKAAEESKEAEAKAREAKETKVEKRLSALEQQISDSHALLSSEKDPQKLAAAQAQFVESFRDYAYIYVNRDPDFKAPSVVLDNYEEFNKLLRDNAQTLSAIKIAGNLSLENLFIDYQMMVGPKLLNKLSEQIAQEEKKVKEGKAEEGVRNFNSYFNPLLNGLPVAKFRDELRAIQTRIEALDTIHLGRERTVRQGPSESAREKAVARAAATKAQAAEERMEKNIEILTSDEGVDNIEQMLKIRDELHEDVQWIDKSERSPEQIDAMDDALKMLDQQIATLTKSQESLESLEDIQKNITRVETYFEQYISNLEKLEALAGVLTNEEIAFVHRNSNQYNEVHDRFVSIMTDYANGSTDFKTFKQEYNDWIQDPMAKLYLNDEALDDFIDKANEIEGNKITLFSAELSKMLGIVEKYKAFFENFDALKNTFPKEKAEKIEAIVQDMKIHVGAIRHDLNSFFEEQKNEAINLGELYKEYGTWRAEEGTAFYLDPENVKIYEAMLQPASQQLSPTSPVSAPVTKAPPVDNAPKLLENLNKLMIDTQNPSFNAAGIPRNLEKIKSGIMEIRKIKGKNFCPPNFEDFLIQVSEKAENNSTLQGEIQQFKSSLNIYNANEAYILLENHKSFPHQWEALKTFAENDAGTEGLLIHNIKFIEKYQEFLESPEDKKAQKYEELCAILYKNKHSNDYTFAFNDEAQKEQTNLNSYRGNYPSDKTGQEKLSQLLDFANEQAKGGIVDRYLDFMGGYTQPTLQDIQQKEAEKAQQLQQAKITSALEDVLSNITMGSKSSLYSNFQNNYQDTIPKNFSEFFNQNKSNFDSELWKQFKIHAEKEHELPNVLFFEAYAEYQKAPSAQKFQALYQQFIAKDAPTLINLAAAERVLIDGVYKEVFLNQHKVTDADINFQLQSNLEDGKGLSDKAKKLYKVSLNFNKFLNGLLGEKIWPRMSVMNPGEENTGKLHLSRIPEDFSELSKNTKLIVSVVKRGELNQVKMDFQGLAERGIEHRIVVMEDFNNKAVLPVLALTILDIHNTLKNNGDVIDHCKAGRARSVVPVMALYMKVAMECVSEFGENPAHAPYRDFVDKVREKFQGPGKPLLTRKAAFNIALDYLKSQRNNVDISRDMTKGKAKTIMDLVDLMSGQTLAELASPEGRKQFEQNYIGDDNLRKLNISQLHSYKALEMMGIQTKQSGMEPVINRCLELLLNEKDPVERNKIIDNLEVRDLSTAQKAQLVSVLKNLNENIIHFDAKGAMLNSKEQSLSSFVNALKNLAATPEEKIAIDNYLQGMLLAEKADDRKNIREKFVAFYKGIEQGDVMKANKIKESTNAFEVAIAKYESNQRQLRAESLSDVIPLASASDNTPPREVTEAEAIYLRTVGVSDFMADAVIEIDGVTNEQDLTKAAEEADDQLENIVDVLEKIANDIPDEMLDEATAVISAIVETGGEVLENKENEIQAKTRKVSPGDTLQALADIGAVKKNADGTANLDDAAGFFEARGSSDKYIEASAKSPQVKEFEKNNDKPDVNVYVYYDKQEYEDRNITPQEWLTNLHQLSVGGGQVVTDRNNNSLPAYTNPLNLKDCPQKNIMIAMGEFKSTGGYFRNSVKPQNQTAAVVLTYAYEFENFTGDDLLNNKCPYISDKPIGNQAPLNVFCVSRPDGKQQVVRTDDKGVKPEDYKNSPRLYLKEDDYKNLIKQNLLRQLDAIVHAHEQEGMHDGIQVNLTLPGLGFYAELGGSASITDALGPIAAQAFKEVLQEWDQKQDTNKAHISGIRLSYPPADADKFKQKEAIEGVFTDINKEDGKGVKIGNIQVSATTRLIEDLDVGKKQAMVVGGDVRTFGGNEQNNASQEPGVYSNFVHARRIFNALMNPFRVLNSKNMFNHADKKNPEKLKVIEEKNIPQHERNMEPVAALLPEFKNQVEAGLFDGFESNTGKQFDLFIQLREMVNASKPKLSTQDIIDAGQDISSLGAKDRYGEFNKAFKTLAENFGKNESAGITLQAYLEKQDKKTLQAMRKALRHIRHEARESDSAQFFETLYAGVKEKAPTAFEVIKAGFKSLNTIFVSPKIMKQVADEVELRAQMKNVDEISEMDEEGLSENDEREGIEVRDSVDIDEEVELKELNDGSDSSETSFSEEERDESAPAKPASPTPVREATYYLKYTKLINDIKTPEDAIAVYREMMKEYSRLAADKTMDPKLFADIKKEFEFKLQSFLTNTVVIKALGEGRAKFKQLDSVDKFKNTNDTQELKIRYLSLISHNKDNKDIKDIKDMDGAYFQHQQFEKDPDVKNKIDVLENMLVDLDELERELEQADEENIEERELDNEQEEDLLAELADLGIDIEKEKEEDKNKVVKDDVDAEQLKQLEAQYNRLAGFDLSRNNETGAKYIQSLTLIEKDIIKLEAQIKKEQKSAPDNPKLQGLKDGVQELREKVAGARSTLGATVTMARNNEEGEYDSLNIAHIQGEKFESQAFKGPKTWVYDEAEKNIKVADAEVKDQPYIKEQRARLDYIPTDTVQDDIQKIMIEKMVDRAIELFKPEKVSDLNITAKPEAEGLMKHAMEYAEKKITKMMEEKQAKAEKPELGAEEREDEEERVDRRDAHEGPHN